MRLKKKISSLARTYISLEEIVDELEQEGVVITKTKVREILEENNEYYKKSENDES